jgi:hypothetical protein
VVILFTTDGTTATSKWRTKCDVRGVSAGKKSVCSGPVTLDKSITAGTYYPLAIADYPQQVTQYDPTGNYAYLSDDGTLTVK